MRRALSIFGLVLAIGATARAVPTNLVTNGGFETGDFSGWTTTQDPNSAYSFLYVGTGDPHSGTYSALFGDTESVTESISQTLDTTPGTTYLVNYYLTADDKAFTGKLPADSVFFSASFDGSVIAGSQVTSPSFPYTDYSFAVTATGTSSTISFGAYDYPGFFSLDDVSVSVAPPNVPEPATLALGLLLLPAAGVWAWKRRQTKIA